MKIIILGCGYLGYNLTNYLSQWYPKLICIGNEGSYSALMYQRFTSVNVFDQERLARIDFEDAIVLDTIALLDNHAHSDQEEKVLQELKIKYSLLLKQLKEKRIRRYIFISSGAVYGNTNQPADESQLVSPMNLYARSKVMVEQLIEQGSLDYLILRLASPYGGFRMTDKRQGVIPILIEKALDHQPFEMLKEKTTIRDYFYISDFAQAIKLLLEYEVSNEIINVGSGKGYSLASIIDVVKRTTGESVIVCKTEPEVVILDKIVLNVDKLRQRTGFDCEIGITSGVYRELDRIRTDRNRGKK